jgi:uncharacterized protein involved in exopolysaccharide biosynthesis
MDNARDTYKVADEVGISAYDALRFLRTQGIWILMVVIIGAAAGYAYSLTRPKQWLATTVLQIGQIPGDQGGGDLLVEPPQRALTRVQLDPFRDRLLARLKLPQQPGADARSDLIRNSLAAQILPTTDMIQLSVRGFSEEEAEATLKVAQDQLFQIHHAIAEPSVAALRGQLAALNQEIVTVNARREKLASRSAAQAQAANSASASADVALSNLLEVTEDGLLDTLTRRRDSMALRLGPTHTFDTRPLDEIAVSNRPVSPRRAVFAALGAMAGFVIGLAIAVTRFARHR